MLVNQELCQKYNFKEIILTKRDRDLLVFVENQGFASFEHLNKRFFTSSGRCTDRLNKLCAFRYLAKRDLKDFFFSTKSNSIGGGYFPHLLSLNVRPNQKIYHIDRSYAQGWLRSQSLFKPSMILHQLILNDIRIFLEKEIEHQYIFNDPILKALSFIEFGRNEEVVPDMSIEDGKLKIAVEIERTPKGKTRYFKRFNYFKDSIYTHVIYYYVDEAQLKPLLKRAGKTSKFAFSHYTTPDHLISPVWGQVSLNEFLHKGAMIQQKTKKFGEQNVLRYD